VKTTTPDTRTHAELREAVLAGEAITPQQLSDARERDDLAELQRQANELAVERDAEAERDRQLAELRADIEALPAGREKLADLAERAHDALVAIAHEVAQRDSALRELARRAEALGIVELQPGRSHRDPSGIGWRRSQTGDAPSLRLDDRSIGAADPHSLLARIALDARRSAGLRETKPGVVNPTSPASLVDQIARIDTTPRQPEPLVPIRWIAGMHTGQVEWVSPSHARHWVERRQAVRTEVG
jgi:hypothetical protein